MPSNTDFTTQLAHVSIVFGTLARISLIITGCWINEPTGEQIGLEYLWMWIAAFLNIVVYVFLALVLKRMIIIDGHRLRWLRGEREGQRSSTNSDAEPRRDEGTIAFQLLL
jgi:hypothetical protein